MRQAVNAPTTDRAVPMPSIEIVSFPVEGMTCASCVNRITRYLAKVEGVELANVNLASESATVRFDPRVVSLADLAAAVDTAGYVARVEQTASADREAAVSEVADARTERDEAAAQHLADLRLRLIIAALLTLPLIAGLARMTVAPWLPSFLTRAQFQFALATPVQFWAAWPFYVGAWKALRHRATDMNTLIAVGTSAAYAYSVSTMVVPSFFQRGRSRGAWHAVAAVLRYLGCDHHAHPHGALPRGTGAGPHLGCHPAPDRAPAAHGPDRP